MHRVGIYLRQLVSSAVGAIAIVTLCAGLSCPVCAQCETLAMEPPDPANEGVFGGGVAIDGDLLAVADPWFNEFRGAVYVYRRVGGEWMLLQSIDDEQLSPNARFGQSLDLDGDRLVVGAELNQNVDAPNGTVFVYRIDGSCVTREAALAGFHADAGEPINGAWFGRSVAIDGGRIAIGWPGFAEGGGRIEIYERDDLGAWQRSAVPAEGEASSLIQYGTRVALSGDILLNGVPDAAAVLAYRFNGSRWLLESTFQPDAGVGLAIDVNGDVIAMGAAKFNGERVFISRYENGAWGELQVVTTSQSAGPDPDFGSSVSLADDAAVLVVGAWTDQVDGFQSGAAHVFDHEAGRWIERAKLTPMTGSAGAFFASSVAVSYDTAVFGSFLTAFVFDGLLLIDGDGNGIADVCELPADLNGDGSVDLTDLIQLLAAWGDCAGPCMADLDGDGSVGFDDVLLLLAGWSR